MNVILLSALLFGLCAWVVPLQAGGVLSHEGASRPNIIFVLSDNHSYYEFGFHGNTDVRTPNLDRLASQSFELSNWHADAFCSPSRSSLLTGINAMRHGVYHTIAGRFMLPGQAVTVAEVLRDHGYATGMFGKWHLGDSYPFRPEDQGFEATFYNEGLSLANPTADESRIRWNVDFRHNGRSTSTKGYCTDQIFDQAIRFITTHKDEPFFCYVPTLITHKPWAAPAGYAENYRGKVRDNLVELYGEIQKLDENVGRLLATVDRLGLADGTMVVFMTDQGMHGNWEEGRGAPGQTTGPPKTHTVDGRHLVAFLVRYPEKIKPGRSDRLAWNPDLLPTLLDLCGIPRPAGAALDGVGLEPVFTGRDLTWPDRTIILQCPRARTGKPFVHAAIKTQRWRLMDGTRLTDALSDPLQMRDVSAQHPQVVKRLRRTYEEWWETVHRGNAPLARLTLGAKEAPSSRLHAMQWHYGDDPWHPRSLSDSHQGGWAVEVARPGRYRIELRRYPKSIDQPVGATSARLMIGTVDVAQKVDARATQITFEVELQAGPTRLMTQLTPANGTGTFSAYFAFVHKL